MKDFDWYKKHILGSPYLSWYMFLLSAVCLMIYSNPIYITDSYEYAIMGSCWIDADFVSMNCAETNAFFRQPFPSFLVAISYLFLDPFVAIAFWSWFSSVCFLWLIWYVATKNISKNLGLWMWFAFASSPFLFRLHAFADARIIVLPFILWSVHSLSLRNASDRMVFWGAVTCVLAFLTRVECLFLFPVYLYVQIVLQKGTWQKTALLFGATLLLWCFGIWQQAGILSISPRYWEGFLLNSTQDMSLQWSLDLFGMGVWSPPMRNIAMTYSPIPMSLDAISLQDWMQWLNISVIDYFPIAVWIFCGVVFLYQAWKQEIPKVIWVFISFTLPSFVITLLPQARDFVFPQSNTFPIWMCFLFGMIWCLYVVSQKISSLGRVFFMLGSIVLLHICSNHIHFESNIEFLDSSQAATNWLHLHTEEDAIVLSSYEIAPIVFRSKRRWQQWPSPFEWDMRLDTTKNTYALVSNMDAHAYYPLAFSQWKEPSFFVADASYEFLIIQLTP